MLLSWSLQRVVLKHVGNMDSRKSELSVTEIIWKGTCGGMNEIRSSLFILYMAACSAVRTSQVQFTMKTQFSSLI